MTRDEPTDAIPSPPNGEVQILRDKFLQRTRSETAVMRALLRRFIEGDLAALATLKAVAHRIGGTGAMLGFLTVSEIAEAIEQLSKQLSAQSGTDSRPAIPQETVERFERRMQELERAVEALGTHPT